MTGRWALLAGLVALALQALIPFTTSAAGGTSSQDAIEINDVMQGSLSGTATEMWFTYWDTAQFGPIGFTLNWAPATPENNGLVTMGIWMPVRTPYGVQPAEVAQGTVPQGTGVGVRYWRTTSQSPTRYWILVRSHLPERVDFAVAQTGSAFPPPGLHITPGSSLAGPSASPTPLPVVGGSPGTTDTRGRRAEEAIPLGAAANPNTGTVPPKTSLWFVDVVPDLNQPIGIDFNCSPATQETDDHVQLRIWAFRNTPNGQVLEIIGTGTKPTIPGMEHGVRFWRGSANKGYTIYIEILNDLNSSIGYGIANIGTAAPMFLPVGSPQTASPTSVPKPTATIIPPAPSATPDEPIPGVDGRRQDFPGTGYTVSGAWLDWYLSHGGAEVLGNPISNVIPDPVLKWHSQYFQKAVLSWQVGPGGVPFIERRLLGDLLYPENEPPLTEDQAPADDYAFFPAVAGQGLGHFVANRTVDGQTLYFLDFFRKYGGVSTFGFPKEEPKLRDGTWTQRFQAATFIYDAAGDAVVLDNLGEKYVAANGLKLR